MRRLATALVLLSCGAGYPSRFGKLTSARWAWRGAYVRTSLEPVGNPDPSPEPQPRRDRPNALAVSKDGKKVYVALLGSEAEPGHEVAVFDAAQERVVKRILLKPAGVDGSPGSGPFRMALHPAGRFLVVTNRFSNFASVIDTESDETVTEIPLDFYAQDLAFDAAGRTLYVADRYLDQVLVVDVRAGAGSFSASVRELGGLDEKAFFAGVGAALEQRCSRCHLRGEGGFYAGPDRAAGFASAIDNVVPGDSRRSRLLRAVTRTRDGGYADRIPRYRSHDGVLVFAEPERDAGYQKIAAWIDTASEGPGIPVGNPGSKPKALALSGDGRFLFVGNTGTQDVSVVGVKTLKEVGSIYIQNAVDGLRVVRAGGRDFLLVATEGIGFGVPKERDPFGGETRDAANPAAQFSVLRDLGTAKVLPRSRQEVLGPYDAVDGTAQTGFRDMQNDIVVVDLGALALPEAPVPGGPERLLLANRYEAHRAWVRYTSAHAESAWGDAKGDVPPDLMRVVGAMPESLAVSGDRVFVTMQASHQVQEWRLDPAASEPSDRLAPVAAFPTGLQPIGIGIGAQGRVFTADSIGGTLSIIDPSAGTSRQAVIDPSVVSRPVPDTNAERGEIFVHSALFSSSGRLSCFHCHRGDTNDGRPWGTHQALGQEYLSARGELARRAIGGTMGVPQLRGLYGIQPLYYEGAFTVFEQPREAMVEQAPLEDFEGPLPGGDYTGLEAHAAMPDAGEPRLDDGRTDEQRSTLEERRDEMFRRVSMRYFGKAFALRDLQRFAGEWQIHAPRLMPNPFDPDNASVARGKELFNDPRAGCAQCHPPPHFAKKDIPDDPEQALAAMTMLSDRDGSFTLIGMNRLDAIRGARRDLEPWDEGRSKKAPGRFTSFGLRGLWDRPPVFLHNGIARTLREVVASPGHPGLGRFKYEPLLGGVGERPGKREVGFNGTYIFAKESPRERAHLASGGRIGLDTHGGTSHLSERELDDLVNFLESIQ